MSEMYPVPPRVRDGSQNIARDPDSYREACARAAHDPDGFWLDIARSRIHWQRPPTRGLDGSYHQIFILRFF